MKSRCFNPSVPEYKHYGGRGITVCDRWRDSFQEFLADMGQRPSKHHSIDRINNEGPYSQNNCRWATWHEQAQNRRRIMLVIVDGRQMSLHSATKAVQVKYTSAYQRMRRLGESFEEAVSHLRATR